MRHFAIGDIHGHIHALNAILNRIAPTKTDRIILLGDYIDHGPDSKAVIDTIISLGNIARPIAGNHEALMLAARTDQDAQCAWLRYGGDQTLCSFKASCVSEIPQRYFDWISALPLYLEDEHTVYVHAGVNPSKPMSRQRDEDLLWRHQPHPRRLSNGKLLVCGHTPRPCPLIDEKYISLDTGIASGGLLSCIDLNTRSLIQATAEGRLTVGNWQNVA
jgi:Calcineurin-like phosphoesterase